MLPAALTMLSDNDLLGTLKFEERRPVLMWQDIVKHFRDASDKDFALAELQQKHAGVLTISQSTLYRKLKSYTEEGIVSLFPLRARKRLLKETDLPFAFIEFWQVLTCESQRMTGTAAAYRSLFNDHLCAGRMIPGYGTDWRGIWTREHGGAPAPAVCPYIPDKVTPFGWSSRQLYRYSPNRYALTAARIGTLAGRELLPKIPTTRVGLRFGQVFIADDRFHDAQVKFAGNLNAQGVVELGAIELLTAHYCTWGLKPIRERADGTREHLREAFMRYLVVDILCRIGYDPMGCKIIGEHGTARLPADVQKMIDRMTCGKVEFCTGAILNNPIAKGLLPGSARGNYRMKAALESAHNRYKNDLALLPGPKGADPAHAPENLPSKQSYHRALMKACIALAEQNPDLIEHVITPFPDYYAYINAVGLIYDRIADDEHHHLEGFEQSHLIVNEFSLFGDDWRPMRELDKLPPDKAAAIRTVLSMDPRSQRPRVMTRREAFNYCQSRSELMRLPDSIVPELLGPDLGDTLDVNKDGTLTVPDKYLPRVSYHLYGTVVLQNGCHQLLDRRLKWLVHMNPLNAVEAFISTPDGIYVGKAPVMRAGTKFDPAHEAFAITKEIETAELKRLAPVGEKRLRDQAKMTEHNAKALTGRDIIEEARQIAALPDVDLVKETAHAYDRRDTVEDMDFDWN